MIISELKCLPLLCIFSVRLLCPPEPDIGKLGFMRDFEGFPKDAWCTSDVCSSPTER